MFVQTRLKPINKLQSDLSKNVDNVAWRNSNGSYRLCRKATDTLNIMQNIDSNYWKGNLI